MSKYFDPNELCKTVVELKNGAFMHFLTQKEADDFAKQNPEDVVATITWNRYQKLKQNSFNWEWE